MILRYFSAILLIFVMVSFASPSNAEPPLEFDLADTTYREVNLQDLFDLTVLTGARDLEEPEIMAEYARLHYCDLFSDHYENEYQWLQVTKGILSDFKEKAGQVPRHYFFRADINLRRYNQESQAFPFTAGSQIDSVGRIEFFTQEMDNICGYMGFRHMPSIFFLQPEQAITLNSIKVANEAELKAFSNIEKSRFGERTVTALFFFTIQGYDNRARQDYRGSTVDFLGELEQVVYYADPYLEQPIKAVGF